MDASVLTGRYLMQAEQRPIGYWIRAAEEALAARINDVQQANGLTRTQWQVLNVLDRANGVSLSQLAEPMRPFADQGPLEAILADLIQRGLVEATGQEAVYELTEQGRRVHTTALESQTEVRQRAVQGISREDYATTVRVLQRMVENLTAR